MHENTWTAGDVSMDDLNRIHWEEYAYDPGVIAAAPGRVNLIGEHTDYNDGFVFPIAINFTIKVAVSKRKDKNLRFFSVSFQDRKRTNLQNLRYRKEDRWANYLKGVINAFLVRGYEIGGLNFTIQGDIPQGAGLASSAALEVATAFALQHLYNIKISGRQLAKLSQEAETKFVGIQCGTMDQFISRLAKEGHAMFLDTRSLVYRHICFKLGSTKILVTNSNVPHGIVDFEYNQRRLECERCVEILREKKSGTTLRDYDALDLRESMGLIPESTRKKCLHVVEENKRVLEAEGVLKRGNLSSFGKLMNRSHESLRDNYEVSCPELDWLVKRAWETEGVYGSKMTGAGFGGCTVTLIENGAVSEYIKKTEQYERIFGFKAEIYECWPSPGAKIIYRS